MNNTRAVSAVLTANVPRAVSPYLTIYQQTFGAGLVGSWIMATLYGVACAQVYNYFTEQTKDGVWMKVLVVALWMLETLHSIFAYMFTYYYLVTSAFDLTAVLMSVWYIGAAQGTRIVIKLLYFGYFTKLVYQLVNSKIRYALVLLMTILTFVHAVFGFIVTARMVRAKLLVDYLSYQKMIEAMAVSQVVADVVLTILLTVVLHRHKTAFKRTNAMINRLIVFAVSRGILTSIAASVEFFSIIINPDNFWYNASEFIIGGLYANSLLLTLNARNVIRNAGRAGTESSFMVPISRMAGSSHGSSTSSNEFRVARPSANDSSMEIQDEPKMPAAKPVITPQAEP